MPPPQGIGIAVILTLVFAANLGLVAAIMYAMARLTGWKRLAAAYPAQPPAPDARKGFGSLGFYSMGNYDNCAVWRADDEHLHLALFRPFQWMGHPPMSIPWAAVEFDPKPPKWGFQQFSIDNIPVRVPVKAVQAELALREALAPREHPRFRARPSLTTAATAAPGRSAAGSAAPAPHRTSAAAPPCAAPGTP
jgi:hypothetical protein